MRIRGHVMGARVTVATRRSVIFNAEGWELVLTFCRSASRVWSAQKPAPSAPPKPLRKERRPLVLVLKDFMAGYYHNSGAGSAKLPEYPQRFRKVPCGSVTAH